VAGIYGVLLVAPLYFMEERIGQDYPPEITHPEYFYGFVSTCLAWQFMYLLISTDPVRYRPTMLLGAFGKLSFFIAVAIMYAHERVPLNMVALGSIDMVLVVLFVVAWIRTPALAERD
jgi:hypothetical protein